MKILAVYVKITPDPCNPNLEQCCSYSDCGLSQVCDARNCVEIGQPRFMLSWFGRGRFSETIGFEIFLDFDLIFTCQINR